MMVLRTGIDHHLIFMFGKFSRHSYVCHIPIDVDGKICIKNSFRFSIAKQSEPRERRFDLPLSHSALKFMPFLFKLNWKNMKTMGYE